MRPSPGVPRAAGRQAADRTGQARSGPPRGPLPARRPPLALRWRRGIRTPSAPNRAISSANRPAWPSVRTRSIGAWRWDQTPPSRTPGAAAIRRAAAVASPGAIPARPNPVSSSKWSSSWCGADPPAARNQLRACSITASVRSSRIGSLAVIAIRRRAASAACWGGTAKSTRSVGASQLRAARRLRRRSPPPAHGAAHCSWLVQPRSPRSRPRGHGRSESAHGHTHRPSGPRRGGFLPATSGAGRPGWPPAGPGQSRARPSAAVARSRPPPAQP